MIDERLKEYMDKITIKSKELSEYRDEVKGVIYPIPTTSLLTRVDYLELTKEELEKAKFDIKVEKKDYTMYECERIMPDKKIKNHLIKGKVKATHIWNVTNQTGVFNTFEDKEEAIKFSNEINSKIYESVC